MERSLDATSFEIAGFKKACPRTGEFIEREGELLEITRVVWVKQGRHYVPTFDVLDVGELGDVSYNEEQRRELLAFVREIATGLPVGQVFERARQITEREAQKGPF